MDVSSDIFTVCLLWPLAGLGAWWIVNSLRPRYSWDAKLSIWQLLSALIAVVWCGRWFYAVFSARGGFANIYRGLWLTTFSSIVLLVYFAQECKAALDCSWMWLLPALFGFQKKRYPEHDEPPESNHLTAPT
ncbi:MAG: hypothetical protein AB1696_13480 [Planctomycetota bacterium]